MSVGVDWDTSEVGVLADQIRTIRPRLDHDLRVDVRDSISDLTDRWRKGAVKSSGKHGPLYPLAIHAEILGDGFEAVTGPLSSMPQGDMNFEYGAPSTIKRASGGGPFPRKGGGFWGGGAIGQRVGQNKPHLDGNNAADIEFPKFVERVAATGFRAFW